jgi:hypothetical protein
VLGAIRQAYQFLESIEVGPQQKLSLPKLISYALPSLIPADRTPAKARDIEIIHEFLDVEVRICFADGNTLPPVRSIRADQNTPKSYFTFTGPQTYDLRHSLICEDTTPTAKSNARKALIPIFLRLNVTVRRVSYFLLVYEADWDRISMVLSNLPEDLENLCMEAGRFRESLDHDVFSVTELFDQLPFPSFEDECTRNIARLERITWRLQSVQSRTATKSAHMGSTTSRLKDCRCTTRVRFPGIELTRAFDERMWPNMIATTAILSTEGEGVPYTAFRWYLRCHQRRFLIQYQTTILPLWRTQSHMQLGFSSASLLLSQPISLCFETICI